MQPFSKDVMNKRSHSFGLYWMVMLVALPALLMGTGCSKKKKKETTPKNAPSKKKEEEKTVKYEDPEEKGFKDEESVETQPQQDTGAKSDTTQGKKGDKEQASSKTGKGSKEKAKELSDLERAQQALHKKNYREVVRITRAILERDYKNYKAMRLMAEAYMDWDKPEMAIKVLRHLAVIKKKNKIKRTGRWHYLNGRYLLSIARKFEMRGLVVEAMRWRASAIREFSHPLCQQLPEALFYLGMLYVENRQFAKGEKALSKALRLAKEKSLPLANDPRLHFNLGVAKYQLKQWKAAHDEWIIALSLRKQKCPECHYNLALLCSLDEVTPQALGLGGDLKRKAACLLSHAKAYRRYLDKTRSKDKRARAIVDAWIRKAVSMSRGGK